MVAMPTAEVLEYLQAGFVKVTRRCEILTASGASFYDDIGLIDGTISVDASRDERRTCDLTLGDNEGRLEATPDGLWYDKLIRPWRGISWPGGSWEAPLGVFMPDRIGDVKRIKKRFRLRTDDPTNVETDPATPFTMSVQVTGRDLTKRMLTSKLSNPLTFVAGTSVEDIVRAEAANSGIGSVILPWDGGANPAPVLDIDQSFEVDTARFSLVSTLLQNYGYEVFISQFDLIVRAFRDPATMPAIWSFQTGVEGNLVTYEKSVNDTELYNRVVVRGSGQTNAFVFAEVAITDPDSPIHSSRIGDRPYSWSSPTVATNDEALTLATMLLKVHALQSYEVALGSIVLPWLEAGEVVAFIDPQAPAIVGDPERFFLSDFTIPIGIGATMDGTAKRVVPVAA